VLLLKNGGMTMSFEDKINQVKDSIKEGLEKITGDENIELENVVSKVKEVAEGSVKSINVESFRKKI